MKNLFTKIIATLIVLSLPLCFAGCGDENSSSSTETTQAVTQSDDISSNESADKTFIKNLHSFDIENGNEFAGAWKIIEGEGSQYSSFVYLFDGADKVSTIIGTQGYVGNYELKTEKDDDGKSIETMTTQLMFGINGTYTYKFSDDDSTVVLTHTETQATTTLQRVISFNIIPLPENNPQIDKKLLGAWKSDNGMYLYFDESGIMYENQFDAIFTYYNYNAVDSVITAKYTMGEETTTSYKYSVDGDKLTYNDYDYAKINVDELI